MDQGHGQSHAADAAEGFADGQHHGRVAEEKQRELSAGGADAAQLAELADAFLHAHGQRGANDQGGAEAGEHGHDGQEEPKGASYFGHVGLGIGAGPDFHRRAEGTAQGFGILVQVHIAGRILEFDIQNAVNVGSLQVPGKPRQRHKHRGSGNELQGRTMHDAHDLHHPGRIVIYAIGDFVAHVERQQIRDDGVHENVIG